MTLSLQGQGHSMQISEIRKMTYFGEITGLRQFSTIYRVVAW